VKRLPLVPLLFWASIGSAQVTVKPAWVMEHRGDQGLVVLHAGMDRTGYDAGHIPGARYAPVMSFHAHGAALPPARELGLAFGALGISERSRVVVTGDPLEVALVYLALDYLGAASQASVLDGGLAAWKAAGYQLTRDVPPFDSVAFSGSARKDLVVDADWVAARLNRPGVVLLDGRSKAEYDGTTDQEGLPRSGHIPGGIHLDWRDTFVAGSDRLLPADSLRARLKAAGVVAGDTVVTYCTVGMRASHLYLVARELGLNARVYVGSMADWSRRSELPVVGPAKSKQQ
jgi:thiosulfate/3-mercaptopyruvate sulfurtransferase